jgi:hypothetical protein
LEDLDHWTKDIRDAFLIEEDEGESPSVADEVEDESLPGPLSDYQVTSHVRGAARFEKKMDDAPEDVAPGFDLCKAPTEEDIEFYLQATSEADARAQFLAACSFVGQTASGIVIKG